MNQSDYRHNIFNVLSDDGENEEPQELVPVPEITPGLPAGASAGE